MEKGFWTNFRPVVCLFFCLLLIFSLSAAAVAAAEEIKVPVTISLTHPIAGAQFQFRHTDGLEFVSFERSEAVKAAMMTPTVARDGNIHIGFFCRKICMNFSVKHSTLRYTKA